MTKENEKNHLPMAQETLSTSLGPFLCGPASRILWPAALLCLSSSGCGGGGRGVREVRVVDGGDAITKNFKLRKESAYNISISILLNIIYYISYYIL